jgi:hypothetical protein
METSNNFLFVILMKVRISIFQEIAGQARNDSNFPYIDVAAQRTAPLL